MLLFSQHYTVGGGIAPDDAQTPLVPTTRQQSARTSTTAKGTTPPGDGSQPQPRASPWIGPVTMSGKPPRRSSHITPRKGGSPCGTPQKGGSPRGGPRPPRKVLPPSSFRNPPRPWDQVSTQQSSVTLPLPSWRITPPPRVFKWSLKRTPSPSIRQLTPTPP
jgi:hypothetical protein